MTDKSLLPDKVVVHIEGERYFLIPASAISWLMGMGDDFEPTPEQQARSMGPGRFWWRSEFRKRAGLSAAAAPQGGEG